MKLEKGDAKKISDSYSLGVFKGLKPLKGGLSNYNFELVTNKGIFIVRFSSNPDDKKESEKINIQLRAINFLAENNFDYKLTNPLKDKNGGFIGTINGKNFWIYKKIEGDTYDNPEKVDIKQLARMVAKYHVIMDRMPLDDIPLEFYDSGDNVYQLFKETIAKMKLTINEKKEKDAVDLLVGENISLIEETFKRVSKINFGKKFIVAHSDWCVFNLIFKGDKIIGLIDFDMFRIAPYIQDIAIAIKEHCVNLDGEWDKGKAKLFFDEYEKIRPIEKFDKYLIKDLIILDCIGGIINFYFHKKKVDIKKRLFMLNWFINPMKRLLDDVKKKDYY